MLKLNEVITYFYAVSNNMYINVSKELFGNNITSTSDSFDLQSLKYVVLAIKLLSFISMLFVL